MIMIILKVVIVISLDDVDKFDFRELANESGLLRAASFRAA